MRRSCLACPFLSVPRRDDRLTQHVAADEDRPGGREEGHGPEEADPCGADDGLPVYRIAGEVQPGVELVRGEVGVHWPGELEARGELEEQDKNHGAHARTQGVVGGGREKDRERRQPRQGQRHEARAGPHESDATFDAYGGAARSGERLEPAREVPGDESDAHEDRRGDEAIKRDGHRFREEQLRAADRAAEDRLQRAGGSLTGYRVPGDERHHERQENERREPQRDQGHHQPVVEQLGGKRNLTCVRTTARYLDCTNEKDRHQRDRPQPEEGPSLPEQLIQFPADHSSPPSVSSRNRSSRFGRTGTSARTSTSPATSSRTTGPTPSGPTESRISSPPVSSNPFVLSAGTDAPTATELRTRTRSASWPF